MAEMIPLDRLPVRFWERVEVTGVCWYFARLDAKGYGRCWVEGKSRLAHRLTYEALVGAVPDGLELDHVCRNRGCCNPDHLEPVTHAENVRRGQLGPSTRARPQKTHCPSGHEYAGDNLYMRHDGRRFCRTCHRLRERVRKDRVRSMERAA